MKIVDTTKRNVALDVNVDDLASQLTLIDLPIFKSITKDELDSLGSSSKKQELYPNVVLMNRQFNQLTFWVVGQILLHDSSRTRAELVSNLIKTAKRLYQLNNLHSSYAIISALLSSPIYRLERTWYLVRKKYQKDKQQFHQLKELFSDNNNYEQLRHHLTNCNLPCIPYLGIYSRDMIYMNEVHRQGSTQKNRSTAKIVSTIQRFQTSQYDHLVRISHLHRLLMDCRYLDELQKFVEDENYQKSLELEPPGTRSPESESHHDTLQKLTSRIHLDRAARAT